MLMLYRVVWKIGEDSGAGDWTPSARMVVPGSLDILNGLYGDATHWIQAVPAQLDPNGHLEPVPGAEPRVQACAPAPDTHSILWRTDSEGKRWRETTCRVDVSRCDVHAYQCFNCGRGLAHDEPCLTRAPYEAPEPGVKSPPAEHA